MSQSGAWVIKIEGHCCWDDCGDNIYGPYDTEAEATVDLQANPRLILHTAYVMQIVRFGVYARSVGLSGTEEEASQ
jgi:hypothetical protein